MSRSLTSGSERAVTWLLTDSKNAMSAAREWVRVVVKAAWISSKDSLVVVRSEERASSMPSLVASLLALYFQFERYGRATRDV